MCFGFKACRRITVPISKYPLARSLFEFREFGGCAPRLEEKLQLKISFTLPKKIQAFCLNIGDVEQRGRGYQRFPSLMIHQVASEAVNFLEQELFEQTASVIFSPVASGKLGI